jgi:hypothetical protein
MKEVLEFNGHKIELETCDILESQGLMWGTLFVGEGRCWIDGEALGFEVHFSGHSTCWAGKAVSGFSSIVTNEFGSFARLDVDVIQFCLNWAADKRPNKLQHAAVVAKFKYGQDSVEFLTSALAYWETQNSERVVFSSSGEGSPIVGFHQTTVQAEVEHLRQELVKFIG